MFPVELSRVSNLLPVSIPRCLKIFESTYHGEVYRVQSLLTTRSAAR
jgi:hypothetical protein